MDLKEEIKRHFSSKDYCEPGVAIIRGAIKLFDALKQGNVLVPIVSNGHYYCKGYMTGLCTYTKTKEKNLPRFNGESYMLNPIDAPGLYSRVEDFFQMNLIELVGIVDLEYISKAKNNSFHIRTTFYEIKLKENVK